MDINGKFTVSIRDLDLDFSELERNIGVVPTKTIKRGQLIGKLKNKEAPYDIWSYEIKISNKEEIFAALATLLGDLLPYCDYIRGISKVYDQVTLNCYLRSDFAQIGFEISDKLINLIEKFGLGIGFHILSFGGVEDN